MRKLSSDRAPKHRHPARDGQAVVRLNSRDHYLGRYGTAERRQRYHRLIAEWEAAQRQPIVRETEVHRPGAGERFAMVGKN